MSDEERATGKPNYLALFSLVFGLCIGYWSTDAINNAFRRDKVFDGDRIAEIKTWLEKFKREQDDRRDDFERKIERIFDRFRDDIRPNVVFPSPAPSPITP